MITRRQFLGQSACAGCGLTGLFSTIGTLRLINATLCAQTPAEDYRALICLFLYGGNDANNLLVPRDTTGYNAYQAARGILAINRNSLLPITTLGDGREFGLHPSMTALKPHFDGGKLALVANVGTLVAPITKAEYTSGGAAIPPYLFSHNDQQAQWQTSVPDNSSARKIGWGGRLADLMSSLNNGAQISMNISLSGNNFFQVGNEVFQYHVTSGGSVGLYEYDATWVPRQQMFKELNDTLALSYGHLFEAEYANIFTRAIANDTLLKGTLANVPLYDRASTGGGDPNRNLFPTARDPQGNLTRLGGQLHMILRLIAARSALSMKRQIFFCAIGGFDTHDDQLADHASLLKQVSDAMSDFYSATTTLGFSDKVTLFTASDFNRTYSTNGKGSDHAWGAHHLVLGGAVQGGRLYGSMPVLQIDGPDDTGSRGSWIPTISTDEYSATLARWFGVSEADMPLVLPNIRRFARPNLGFMG
jgi:uncharacterized protein (DUF1501 family)